MNCAGKTWLFNLNTDPTERNNPVKKLPERVKIIQKLLDQHNAEQKEPAWPFLVETPIPNDKTLIDPTEEGDEYIFIAN